MKKTWTSRGRRRRPLRRAVLVVLLLALLGPALPVAALRFVPPLGSALMVQRFVEAQSAGRRFQIRRDWVPLSRIAPSLRAAVVASEDQTFYVHHGFDWKSLGDALRAWSDGRKLRGASTISQQVAKNLFLWPGRSIVRKALEAWFTLWIELLWPKQRILEVYLNVAELGDGVFGAEAAARRYFGQSAASLDASESALLAAMLPSPRRSNPANPSHFLRERQHWILAQIRPSKIQPPPSDESPPPVQPPPLVEPLPPVEPPPDFEPPPAFESPPPSPADLPSVEGPGVVPPATEGPTPPDPPPAS